MSPIKSKLKSKLWLLLSGAGVFFLVAGVVFNTPGLNAKTPNQASQQQALKTMQVGLDLEKAKNGGSDIPAAATDKNLYRGMQPVQPVKMKQLFPQVFAVAKPKPMLLVFHSKFCLDCKKMMPTIQKLGPKHPGVVIQGYDVFEDKKNNALLFNAFKPVTVPTLVFINRQGEIKNVLYNFQSYKTIGAEIKKISG